MDDLLTAALADAADALVELMPDTAGVVATTLSPDGYGGQTATETVAATVPCRWVRLAGQELLAAQRVAPSATVAVTVPYGTAVSRSNALRVAGLRLEVIWVADGTFKAQTRCLCAEVA